MIARVRGVIFFSICLTSIHHVYGSLSTRTGVPPLYTIARAQEMIVNDGRMTSSPGLSSKHATASCKAVVPLDTAMPYRLPQYAAHFLSNSSMNLPADEIQPLRKHSVTFSNSVIPREGSLTGITVRSAPFHRSRCKDLASPPRTPCPPASGNRVLLRPSA